MKTKLIAMAGAVLAVAGMTSCDLDLEPQDYYGADSYWRTEAQAIAYIDGIHKHLRDGCWTHNQQFGEFRGGHYKTVPLIDGSGVTDGAIFSQNFDENHTGVTKFGDYYGRITNVNLYIARVTDNKNIGDAVRNYTLGIAHGLRAFYYFDLYRIYGGVPLRLTVEVIDGELDPTKLYMARSEPSKVMLQIKDDLKKSMDYFDASGHATDFNYLSHGAKCYWSKAATECLAADVYLWNAKVTTGDNAANTADLTYAKERLNSVMTNYGLSLQKSFEAVHDADNKANSEIVFAIRYAEGEKANENGSYAYSMATGMLKDIGFYLDGRPFDDPMKLANGNSTSQRREYKFELYQKFDEADTRRDATFIPFKTKKEDDWEYGTIVVKNAGKFSSTGIRQWIGDYVYYRLPWVYLAMAEIANMEGVNADVEKYINMVRERAYGDAWNVQTYGYTAGDFKKNELAILAEKDKEFVMEGQRWWDLLRMKTSKDGGPETHLVFCKEGAIEYGILTDDKVAPVLNYATEAHKVLWPIDKALMQGDPKLEQTPGYNKQ